MSFTKSVQTGSVNIPFLWINNHILSVNIDAIVSIGSEMELKILGYTYYIELVHSHAGVIVCVFTRVCKILDLICDRVNEILLHSYLLLQLINQTKTRFSVGRLLWSSTYLKTFTADWTCFF